MSDCGCDLAGNPCFCGGTQDPNCDSSWCPPGVSPGTGTLPAYCTDSTACGGQPCRDCGSSPSCADNPLSCILSGQLNWLLIIGGLVLAALVVPSLAKGLGEGIAARV